MAKFVWENIQWFGDASTLLRCWIFCRYVVTMFGWTRGHWMLRYGRVYRPLVAKFRDVLFKMGGRGSDMRYGVQDWNFKCIFGRRTSLHRWGGLEN